MSEKSEMRPGGRAAARTRRGAGGFTLVELLIVIAIIMLLLCLLFPAIHRVQDDARTVQCLSNVRQLTAASILYAQGNNGNLPSPGWKMAGEVCWLYGNLQMDRLTDLTNGVLWAYMGGSYRAYRCPSDPQPNDTDPLPSRPNNSRMITSYCSNGSWCRYGAKGYDASRKSWNTYKVGDFAAEDVLFWEAWEAKDGGWWWDGSNNPWEGMTYRHNDRGIVGCADGHVERMPTATYYALAGTAAPAVRNRLWNTPYSPSGH